MEDGDGVRCRRRDGIPMSVMWGIDGSPLADANGDGTSFHRHFFMPVFHSPFMALNVTYVGLVLVEKSCAIFSPVLLAILKSWRIVCASPKEI